jgi:hypothetical protein
VPQGDLPAALEGYKISLAIRDRLAKADPSNASSERPVRIARDETIGGVLLRQGQR